MTISKWFGAVFGDKCSRRRALMGKPVVLLGVCLGCVMGVLLLALASAASTSTPPVPPAMILTDSAGDSITIDSTPAVSCIGSCTTTTPATASSGGLTWAGTLGVFTISVAGGQSKPALPQAQINLVLRVSIGSLAAGASNPTLSVKWSDTGFGGNAVWPQTHLYASYSTQGAVSLSFAGFVDDRNILFGAGTAVATIGPLSSSLSSTITGPGPTQDPFSMTESVTATLGANSSFSLAAFNLAAVPPPLTVACPTASGQVGVAYDSHITAGGGLPPYTYSISGNLAPGLWLNSSTGEITGTPTTPGTYSFTAQAMDASGNSAQNTVQSPCSITIVMPPSPLALACPDSSGPEGIPYSSALVATGGTPQYSFFITSGALPPGLNLNSSTGAITGTDTAADGSFTFTAKAVDSSGSSVVLICLLLMAAAPHAAPVCELWYTTNDAKTFVLNWTFDANATGAALEELVPLDFAPQGTQGQKWTDLKSPGSQSVTPATARSYNLTFMINGAKKVCSVKIDLPACRIWARGGSGNKFRLGWTTVGTSASGMTFDPSIKPSGPIWASGSANINPTEDTLYTLSVQGKIPKDSRQPQGDSIGVTSVCSTYVSPLLCTISVNPNQVAASVKDPATVNVTWDATAAKQVVLQRLANNNLITPLKGDPPNPQNNPPKSQNLNVTQTTQFFLNVTSADNAKASCTTCVLNRPDKSSVLDIPPLFQANSMWCWLTVGEMIFKWLKPPVPSYDPWKGSGVKAPVMGNADKLYQWGILAVVHPQCWLFPDACAAVGGGSWQTLQRMLAQYPVAAGQQNGQKIAPVGCQQKPGCLSADEIKKEIDAGRPIIAGITPGAAVAPPSPAHVALIIGYINKGNDIDLIVNDPWPYQLMKQQAPYTQFGGTQNCESNYTIDRATFCSKAAWNGSLINIQ